MEDTFEFYNSNLNLSLPVFETLGVQCNKCFSDLYILHNCFHFSSNMPDQFSYRGYRAKPLRTPATKAEHRSKVCKCSNVGIIQDEDNHLHVYVEDIRSCTVTKYYVKTTALDTYKYRGLTAPTTDDYPVIHKEKLGASESFSYVDYSEVKHSTLSKKKKYKPIPYSRKTPIGLKKAQDLLKALTNYTDFHANKWHTLPGIAK